MVSRLVRSAALGGVAAVSLLGCATRHPETRVPPVPVASSIVWRVDQGDVIRVRIYREPDLSGESPVNEAGMAYFAGVGRVPVQGLTLDSLQAVITARYSKLILEAAVDVTIQRSVVVYGQARSPGIYMMDPTTTVLGLLSKAGGASGTGKNPTLTLVKADGRQFLLPREARLATIDITRTDAVYVQEEGFFGRNQQVISAATVVVSIVTSVLSIVLILTRH